MFLKSGKTLDLSPEPHLIMKPVIGVLGDIDVLYVVVWSDISGKDLSSKSAVSKIKFFKILVPLCEAKEGLCYMPSIVSAFALGSS